jgi:hypothetical protein
MRILARQCRAAVLASANTNPSLPGSKAGSAGSNVVELLELAEVLKFDAAKATTALKKIT